MAPSRKRKLPTLPGLAHRRAVSGAVGDERSAKEDSARVNRANACPCGLSAQCLILTLDKPCMLRHNSVINPDSSKNRGLASGLLEVVLQGPPPCEWKLRQLPKLSPKQPLDRAKGPRLPFANRTDRYFRNLRRRSPQRWLSERPIGSAASAYFVSISGDRAQIFSKRSRRLTGSPAAQWRGMDGICQPHKPARRVPDFLGLSVAMR